MVGYDDGFAFNPGVSFSNYFWKEQQVNDG
jgi:hypothetical protein